MEKKGIYGWPSSTTILNIISFDFQVKITQNLGSLTRGSAAAGGHLPEPNSGISLVHESHGNDEPLP